MIPYDNDCSYLEKGSNFSSRLTDSRIRKTNTDALTRNHFSTVVDRYTFIGLLNQLHIIHLTKDSYKELFTDISYYDNGVQFLSHKFQLHSSLNTLMSVH